MEQSPDPSLKRNDLTIRGWPDPSRLPINFEQLALVVRSITSFKQLGNQLPQLGAFILELLQPSHFAQKVVVFALPVE
jgi:hypothetical protein